MPLRTGKGLQDKAAGELVGVLRHDARGASSGDADADGRPDPRQSRSQGGAEQSHCESKIFHSVKLSLQNFERPEGPSECIARIDGYLA